MKFYLIHKSTKNPPDEREKYVETLTTDSEQETAMQETEISPQILRVDKNKQEQILDETVNCPDQLKDVTEKHDKPEKLVEKVREETDENKTELDQTEISQQNVRDDTDDHQPDKKHAELQREDCEEHKKTHSPGIITKTHAEMPKDENHKPAKKDSRFDCGEKPYEKFGKASNNNEMKFNEKATFREKRKRDIEKVKDKLTKIEEFPDATRDDSKILKKKGRHFKLVYRCAILLLILTGLLEDFPVVVVSYCTSVVPICGTPARQEVGSVHTLVTILSSMLNSLWTMILLFSELCGYQNLFGNISSCCQNKRESSKDTFKPWKQNINPQKTKNWYAFKV